MAKMHRQVEQRLMDRGVRYTKGRKAVVTALATGNGPQSAAELSEALKPTLPLSSIYRSLAVLEEAGTVVPHFGAKTITRFELAEWLMGHHHHLVCIDCGTVEDVDVPDDYETQVEEVINVVTERARFAATNHSLEIEGRCAQCAA